MDSSAHVSSHAHAHLVSPPGCRSIDVYILTTETESCNVRANCGEGIKGDFLAWVGKKKHPSPLAITLLSHSIYSKFHDKKMTRTMTLTGKPIQTSRKRNDFSKNSYVK